MQKSPHGIPIVYLPNYDKQQIGVYIFPTDLNFPAFPRGFVIILFVQSLLIHSLKKQAVKKVNTNSQPYFKMISFKVPCPPKSGLYRP